MSLGYEPCQQSHALNEPLCSIELDVPIDQPRVNVVILACTKRRNVENETTDREFETKQPKPAKIQTTGKMENAKILKYEICGKFF